MIRGYGHTWMIKKSVLQRVIFRKKQFREILAAEILPTTSPFLQKLAGQSDALKGSNHFISNFYEGVNSIK